MWGPCLVLQSTVGRGRAGLHRSGHTSFLSVPWWTGLTECLLCVSLWKDARKEELSASLSQRSSGETKQGQSQIIDLKINVCGISKETALRWMASEGRSDWRPAVLGRPLWTGCCVCRGLRDGKSSSYQKGRQGHLSWKGQRAGALLVGVAEGGAGSLCPTCH